MATKEVIICDKCEKQTDKPIRFNFECETKYNGTDTDTIVESIDLCHHCVANRIQAYTRNNLERGRLLYGILNGDFSVY